MTLKETICVPAEVVDDLRTALYARIGDIAQTLDTLTLKPDRERHPERYDQPLQDLDRIRSLLGTIRWRQSSRPISVELDLRQHRHALLCGLRTALTAIDRPATANEPPPAEEIVRERACAIRALLCAVRPERRA